MERLKGGAGSADEREMSKRSGHRLVAVPGFEQMESSGHLLESERHDGSSERHEDSRNFWESARPIA